MTSRIPLVFCAVLFAGNAVAADAQVRLSSPVVAITGHQRFGDYQVHNGTDVPQEVQVGLRFAYPRPDSNGVMILEYGDSATSARHGADAWARVFPRQFVLPPGGMQVVRVMVSPPAGLPEGMYWTRIVTSSTPKSRPVDSTVSGVSPNIIVRLEQVTTLLYRRGDPQSQVELREPAVHRSGDTVNLVIPLRRTAAAPFFGTVSVRASDAGRVVAERQLPVSVYFDATPRLALWPARCATQCDIEVRVESGRPDVPVAMTPPSPPSVMRVRG